jgi:alanyl-tRNA synthetase
MQSKEIREKYIRFFESRGHLRIDPSPLVLEGDPTTLFTSSGMQQLVPFLKGEKHEKGLRLVDTQPSLRTQDIEEVGDNRHTTFFEMLGNWSLGDYFKKEQLPWIWDFFTKELAIPAEKLHVSIFEGNEAVPKDTESFEIWKSLGLPEDRIHFYDAKKNWWSRSGAPEAMPAGEIGGPDSEIFYDFGTPVHDGCHPNCDCGRFMEIGNNVFIEYQKNENGSLSPLKQKNVDFGGGLERTAAVLVESPDIFKTDIYQPFIKAIEEYTDIKYGDDEVKNRNFRIIADHLRASIAIISEGIYPSNKLQGYTLRRLIRRSVYYLKNLKSVVFGNFAGLAVEALKSSYFKPISDEKFVIDVLSEEAHKFENALTRGTIKLGDAIAKGKNIDGKLAFDLYQTEGFPLELTLEILEKDGKKFSEEEKESFEKEFEKHKELSRTASAGMFKGGLADNSENVTKLHTTTHLLHAALRKVLGEHVSQKGSNITSERLRFDFSNSDKLTDEQLKEVERLMNEAVDNKLPVSFETKKLTDAINEGALHFFAEKYGDDVKVYTIGDSKGEYFSKEVCGGPHVDNTEEIGRVRIIKQEKVGSGIIRIYVTNKPE